MPAITMDSYFVDTVAMEVYEAKGEMPFLGEVNNNKNQEAIASPEEAAKSKPFSVIGSPP